MVHLIVMTHGSPQQLGKVEGFLANHRRGWTRIEAGVWLVSTDVTTSDWRDFIRTNASGTQFLVAQLSGSWATSGVGEVAKWLGGANGSF